MDKNFDILKNIDNEELYNKTFITFENLEAIKAKNFEAFTRFKLMGFIDILSKRLNLDLSEYRAEAIRYFDSIEPVIVIEETPKKQIPLDVKINKKVVVTIIVGLVVVLLGVLINFFIDLSSKKDLTDVQVSPPSKVENLPPVSVTPQESNITFSDENKTDSNITAEPQVSLTKDIGAKGDDIKIVPTQQLWIGIIELDTNKKTDYTTSDEIVIDKTKDQIIVINGAYLSLMVGDKIQKTYNRDGRVRFICKDGKIEEIRFEAFKALNDGKAWK